MPNLVAIIALLGLLVATGWPARSRAAGVEGPAPPPVATAPAPTTPATKSPTAKATANEAPSHRSPVFALTLALLGSGASLGLIAGGMRLTFSGDGLAIAGASVALSAAAVAPSAGHMYASRWGAVVGFSLGRAASLGALAVGTALAWDNYNIWGDSNSAGTAGAALIGLGLLGWLGITLTEVVMTYGSARAFNRRQRARPAVAVSPFVLPSPGDHAGLTVGIAVTPLY